VKPLPGAAFFLSQITLMGRQYVQGIACDADGADAAQHDIVYVDGIFRYRKANSLEAGTLLIFSRRMALNKIIQARNT
jgi:hypothetical protein